MGVAAIVPVHNEPPSRVGPTLASVVDQVDQVIVVENGSRAWPLLSWPSHVKYIHLNQASIPLAHNVAVDEATAEYVAICSAGDTWAPGKVSAQYHWMSSRDLPCTFHNYLSGGKVRETRKTWPVGIYRDNQFCLSTAMVRTGVARTVRWDEELTWCSDWDFAVRMQHQHGWLQFPGVWGTAHEGVHTGRHRQTEEMRKKRVRDRSVVARRARNMRKP